MAQIPVSLLKAQVSVADGTAGAPSVSFSNDTNTGLYRPGADAVGVVTNGVERMRVDASGNVGIGTTNPSNPFQVVSSVNQISSFVGTTSDQLSYIRVNSGNSTSGNNASVGAIELTGTSDNSGHGRHSWIGSRGVIGTTYRTQLAFRVRNESAPWTWNDLPDLMVIDGNGNVGIGTNNPQARLHLEGDVALSGANRYVGTTTSHDLIFNTNSTERMRIVNDSWGRLFIRTTSPFSGVSGILQVRGQESQQCCISTRIDGSGQNQVEFCNGSTRVGSIQNNGTTGVSYNTTSDYRLKTNVRPITNACNIVNLLKPCIFNHAINGSDDEVHGFIAHEVQECIPYVVSGRKDEVDEDNNPIYQGLDYGRITPILTAALQESLQTIESLQQKVFELQQFIKSKFPGEF